MTRGKESPLVEQLVHNHLGLVVEVAHEVARTMGRLADIDEAIACGRVGLLKAARQFDPALGNRFSAYAKGCIRGETIDGLRKLCAMPRRAHEKVTAPRDGGKEKERMRNEHLARMATAKAEGLLPPLGMDTQDEFIAISGKTPADVATERNQRREQLFRGIEKLPPAEADLIRRRDLENVPFERIADELGFPETTTRRLYARARKRLEKLLLGQLKDPGH